MSRIGFLQDAEQVGGGDVVIDLLEDRRDVAIRTETQPGSRLTQRRRGSSGPVAAGSADHLRRAGTPKRPEDPHGTGTWASTAPGKHAPARVRLRLDFLTERGAQDLA